MPLKPGCDKATIQENIAMLIHEGKAPDQAAAIAHENCRRGKAYITPASISVLEQLKALFRAHPTPGVSVVKAADGLRYMRLVTSNAYRDREREWITTKDLERYVERAWLADDVCDPGNTLRFWHSQGEIGDVVWTDMEGPFLMEVAKERPDAVVNLAMDGAPERLGSIKSAWDYVELNPDSLSWGASHGFEFERKVIDARANDATYDGIAKFESSVLPLSAAANSLTFSGVIDMANRDEVLDKLVGQAGAAETLRKGVADAVTVLDKAGVEHKSTDLPPEVEAKLKALMDKLGTETDSFVGKIFDSPPQGVKEAIMQILSAALGQAGPAEDGSAGEPAAEAAPGDMGMMGKAMQNGQIKLLDTLVQTQAGQAADIQELVKAIKALTPLNTLAVEFQALRAELAAMKQASATVQAQLGGRPKSASQATETVVTNDKQLEEAQKQLTERDPFWGREIRKPVPGAD